MAKRRYQRRRYWSREDLARLRELYPDTQTKRIARLLKHSTSSLYIMAAKLGLKKSAAALSENARPLLRAGIRFRFKPGHTAWNRSMKGWKAGGRSAEFRFKKGHVSTRWDPETYAVGALRLNADGYVDIKMHDGYRPWREFHVVLWEDAYGPVPAGHCVTFMDRDRLNICLENLELISRAENMRRNSIHNLPAPLKSTINLLGQLKRRIREKPDRGSAQSFV